MKAAPPSNVPNAAQTREFARHIAKWQTALGLMGWRIEKSRRKSKAMADMKVSYDARLATWALGDFGSTEINSYSLESTALHEVLHVLLYEIWFFTSEDAPMPQIESAEHAVITVLEKLLCPPPPPSPGTTE